MTFFKTLFQAPRDHSGTFADYGDFVAGPLGESAMKTFALLAALPVSLALAACGEEMDGSDTADLGSDATVGETGTMDGAEYQPGDDGPLQNDVEPDAGTMTGDAMADEPMVEDGMAEETLPAAS